MDIRENIKNYISGVFMSFGISAFILNCLAALMGDSVNASGASSLFSMGSSGLSVETAMQLFLLSALLSASNIFFASDLAARKFSSAARNIMTAACTFCTAVLFSFIFGWFRAGDIGAWISFIASFAAAFLVYILFITKKEEKENKELNDALRRIKDEL